MSAFLLFNCFSGPVADVLRQPGENIENRRFPYIGLTGQGYDELPFFLCLLCFTLCFRQFIHAYIRRFAASQHHTCISHLDNHQTSAFTVDDDLRILNDTHPCQAACQRRTPLNGMDNPCFASFQ